MDFLNITAYIRSLSDFRQKTDLVHPNSKKLTFPAEIIPPGEKVSIYGKKRECPNGWATFMLATETVEIFLNELCGLCGEPTELATLQKTPRTGDGAT